GRLHDGTAQLRPLPRSDPTGRLTYPALDLGAAGDEYCERELAYLSPIAHQPSSVLGRWERELSGPSQDGASIGRHHEFLLRYCQRVQPNSAAPAKFRERYRDLSEQIVQASPPTDPAQAEDRERVLRWLDDSQALAARLKCLGTFLQAFQSLLSGLREKLLTPWDRALRIRRFVFFHRKAAYVPLSRTERAAIHDAEFAAAL